MNFTLDEIKDLMKTMQATGLGKFELAEGDFSLKLAAKSAPVVQTVAESAPVVAPAVTMDAPMAVAPQGNFVKAPIVGTFYGAPAPDKAPFVAVGQAVKKGDVLYIIESMKLMNEIQAEQDGVIADILVQNGDAVEYDQPILVLE